MQNHLHVAIDIGSVCHRVAIGLDDGAVIDEFDCPHTPLGLSQFFKRVQSHEHKHAASNRGQTTIYFQGRINRGLSYPSLGIKG
jgi:hypothetical protein